MKKPPHRDGAARKRRPGRRGSPVSAARAPASPALTPEKTEQLMELALKVIDQAPDIRQDKVARLKEAVEQGRYRIDARKVANALITELLRKR